MRSIIGFTVIIMQPEKRIGKSFECFYTDGDLKSKYFQIGWSVIYKEHIYTIKEVIYDIDEDTILVVFGNIICKSDLDYAKEIESHTDNGWKEIIGLITNKERSI